MVDVMTAEKAKAAVLDFVTSWWGDGAGTPHVGDVWEDEDGFLVEWGAREYLVDHNEDYRINSNLSLIVNRWTGIVDQYVTSDILERIDKMVESTHVA